MKFTTPSIVATNPVPEETRIYYSKTRAVSKMWFSLVILCVGIFNLIFGVLIAALICFIFAGLSLYARINMFLDESPQIILNKKGIQTAYKQFYTWQQIKAIDIDSMSMGRGGRHYFLVYKPPDNEKVEVKINNLNIDQELLKKLVHFYSLYEI
ncbi:hypothetical protein FO440_08400 [Mucilaginibacter corticis]|uniref:PH domain-containing protein n=1 Tax=Mucilaginibacter corticis TaxID=2597670 RepID=A0A556MWJ4_9SPHI|nr:hypothetical protein [Mucilaginibacter corticis]TSJ44179.1 hypothetical protein FO440_08400 [Mucilaginibacter corticis]